METGLPPFFDDTEPEFLIFKRLKEAVGNIGAAALALALGIIIREDKEE